MRRPSSPSPLIVGLDVSAAAAPEPTGVARAILGLAGALAERPDIELRPFARFSRWKRRSYLAGLPRLSWFAGPAIWGRGVQVFHGPDTRLPRGFGLPMAATIHDFSALQPAGFSRPSFRETRARHYAEAARRARRIIVYTEAIAAEAVERLSLPRERIRVVPLAPSSIAPAADPRAVADEILVLGELSRRKNTETALLAFSLARERSAAARRQRLVVVGRVGFGGEAARALIAEGQGVEAPGYLSGEALAERLSRARLLLFPSRYEGFGLPVLEAMACGVPVVAGSCGAVREVAAGGARLCEPEDVEAFAEALVELCEDEGARRAQAEAGRSRAADFSWQRSAAALAEVYRELAL